MGRDLLPALALVAGFVAALALFFWLLTSGLDPLVQISFVIAPLSLFAVVFLWRFSIGRVAGPPEQALAAIAHAMRRSLYRVEEAPGELTIRIGSVSAVKIRARAVSDGTKLSYTVYATSTGWSILLILFFLWELAFFTIPAVLYILLEARGFVRERILPLVASGVLPAALAPPGDVRAILIDSLSEGYRLASEAGETERSTYHDQLLIAFVLGFLTWAVVVIGMFLSSAGPDFGQRLRDATLVATVAGSALAVGAGLWARLTFRRRIQRLDRWAASLREALAREVGESPVAEPRSSTFELLVEASREIPTWFAALGRGGPFREPGTWLAVFMVAFWGLFLIGGAIAIAASLPLLAVPLGAGGAALLSLAYVLYARWRRRVDTERARFVSSWDLRLATIRGQMEAFLKDL